MKTFVWIALFLVGLTGVVIPLAYFWVASGLPKLDSEFDLENQLKLTVEGERMSLKMGLYSKDKGGVAYEKPDFSKLPKDFVAVYISQLNCPTYFQTPREDGFKWGWRMYGGTLLGARPEGDGRCERYFAMRLAEMIGVRPGLQRAIAANRIHSFLQKDQLLAYELSGTLFERAVVGPDAASVVLFAKPMDQLQLSEIGEFALGLPINGLYDELRACRNPSLLRQARDGVLGLLANQALVTEERAKTAQAQPLACLHIQ